MKKKELKRMIMILNTRVLELEKNSCKHCEYFRPKTVKFHRWEPSQIQKALEEEPGSGLLEKYIDRKAVQACDDSIFERLTNWINGGTGNEQQTGSKSRSSSD